jgi:hypothetical protein
VVCSLEAGYTLILCDHFQSDPPGVGYVILDVVEIPCKGTCIATSSLGIQRDSHGFVMHCMEMPYSIKKISVGRLLPPD